MLIQPKQPKYALRGLAIGVLVALSDFMMLGLFNVQFTINGESALWIAGPFLTSTFAILGYVAGKLYEAKKNLTLQTEIIQRQLQALEASQEKTLQYEKLASIGRLSAGVAHEVRNPLGVIRSAAGLIAEESENLSDNAKKASDFIQKEILRLDHFIAQLLDFSKPLSAKFDVIRFEDIQMYLRDLIRHEPSMLEENIHISILGESIPFEGDLGLLTQALFSLVKNATEATGKQGRVTVQAVVKPPHIIIYLRDDGPGIAKEMIDNLYEPFFTTKALGTGLGLVMAERMIKGHGGQLTYVEHEGAGAAGEGACFLVTIPLDSTQRFLGDDDAM